MTCVGSRGGRVHGAGRRNTRTFWLGVDFKTVSRDTLQWVLRAAGKRWEGKREELEQRMHECVASSAVPCSSVQCSSMQWPRLLLVVARCTRDGCAVSCARQSLRVLTCVLMACAPAAPCCTGASYVYEFRLISEKAEEERREHLRLTLESTGTIYAFGANYDGAWGRCRACRLCLSWAQQWLLLASDRGGFDPGECSRGVHAMCAGQLGDGSARATNNPRYNPEVAGKGVVRVVAVRAVRGLRCRVAPHVGLCVCARRVTGLRCHMGRPGLCMLFRLWFVRAFVGGCASLYAGRAWSAPTASR